MYIPTAFQEHDKAKQIQFMRDYSFATLVTQGDDEPFATHLPFLVDEGCSDVVRLRCHVARANPQWRQLPSDTNVLVIFQGPHAYVSPSWYETSEAVPTWNYTAVHAYGLSRRMSPAELRTLLADSTSYYEAPSDAPWSIDSQRDEFIEKLSTAIVGIEINVSRIEAKFKLSQNRSAADISSVANRLESSHDQSAREVAKLMRQLPTATPPETP